MALVDEHDVEELDWDGGIVRDRNRLADQSIARVELGSLFQGRVEFLGPSEHRVEALYSGDHDASNGIDVVRCQTLDVVELGKFPSIVGGPVRLELLQRLSPQVRTVDEEQNAV